jgi:acylphosphatase
LVIRHSSFVIPVASVCKRVLYTGQVQGVGFRATARRLARSFPVTGYVRNLPGGEVELVAEGEESAVADFLAAVARDMAGYVAGAAVTDASPCGLPDFRIRH